MVNWLNWSDKNLDWRERILYTNLSYRRTREDSEWVGKLFTNGSSRNKPLGIDASLGHSQHLV